MPTYAWLRNSISQATVSGRANMNVVQAPVGVTINRTIFGWSCWVSAPMWAADLLVGQPVYAGLQTVRSGYGGTIPHPDSSPLTELSYPGERWLYYEAAELVPAGSLDYRRWDKHIMLRTVETFTPRQCEKQVLNTYAAQTLNVYVSVACPTMAGVGLELAATSYVSALYS